MRIATARDLGLVIRQSRRDRGQTQAQLAAKAGVGRRRLSDLEAGKATAEVGLVLRTLHALGLGFNALTYSAVRRVLMSVFTNRSSMPFMPSDSGERRTYARLEDGRFVLRAGDASRAWTRARCV
ncbi:helix-turn-helix domain-containing protein [Jidongwangia harbinensis]|uniref:helix-turn-helix domain-containing protein n=1 Tax=Jidongwangia harbinensis TaxID=2878561 RepID=UPI001CD9D274|nr:helix-turn-helix domain-containing protein [Jidongwangia harbinensis]